MKLIKHLPNLITSGNLLCGILAILQIFSGELQIASYLVFLAALLDFFDGFTARILKVSSAIGKDLDSLADMVTFGVVPGLMVYRLMEFSIAAMDQKQVFWIAIQNNSAGTTLINASNTSGWYSFLPYFALLIPIFSAWRLAKFNNDPRQSNQFIGLPTPANAIFIAALLLNLQAPNALFDWLNDYRALLILTALSSFSLVANLPLLALKFKDFSWANNKTRYLFLSLSLSLLILFKLAAIPLLILCYVFFSLVNNIFFKAQH